MEQMTLFPPPYKYIIDTSSLLSQKPSEPHRRTVYQGQWEKIEEYIQNNVIVTCSEIMNEVHDEDIKKWLIQQNCIILPIDNLVQKYVRKIVTEYPKIIEFSSGGGSSSGDVFLIATAMKYNLTVITEENPDKPTKIPKICEKYGIEALNITGLSEKEGWVF